jgi:23S rRNA (uracil1939-C5)-methyltransferase
MSRRRSRKQRLPTEPVELEIESLSHEGRGVARIEGKVAFVDGALSGETVSAIYVRSRSQLDELRTESVLQASSERVSPPCGYAGQCGGCSLQHLDTTAQLNFKQSVLLEHLAQSTGLSSEQFELLPNILSKTEHYRRKARLAVRVVQKKGGVLVGFREKYSSFITDMHSCHVLVAEVAQLIDPLREMLNSLSGKHAIPQIEVAVGEHDGQEERADNTELPLQVALVFRHLQALSEEDQHALQEFCRTHAVHCYLQPGGTNTVHRIYPAASESPERLYYYLPEHDISLAFHPMDFTQVNGEVNRQIIDRALSLLDVQKGDTVLDLFCGLGNFTLPLARRAAAVIGVEGSDEMVQRGSENAARNGLTNTEFFAADLSKPLSQHVWAQKTYDKILLDPPRSGALEIIPEVAQLGAARIAYVSCNPITLARDAAVLQEHGYKLKSAGVMDMFPHTTHVESMAIFERK